MLIGFNALRMAGDLPSLNSATTVILVAGFTVYSNIYLISLRKSCKLYLFGRNLKWNS